MFETHKLSETGFESVKRFKSHMNKSISAILQSIPEGRDKAIFVTKVEEAMFFATRAIASAPGNHTEIITY